ncbi:MAG TPA: FtsX-like permease family protein [Anaerolineales bacterium]|nr:FtsX-like permease family protein [Anaerolineales bacterium]
MQLYLRLAWRNIWRHRRRTVIIVLAMGFSLALMMWYDGMIDGFNQAIYGNAIRVLGGNIQIHAAGYREKIDSNPLLPLVDASTVIQAASSQPNVIAATPRIITSGLATSPEGAFAVSIIGIDPDAEKPVSLIADHISAGNWLTASDQDSILVGKALADAMGIQIGDRVTLVGSDIHKQNRQRTMVVTGIYSIGIAATEKNNAYITLAEAQNLYGLPNQVTEVDLTLKKLGQEPSVIAALTPALPGYEVESWDKNYPDLKNAIDRKGAVMNVFGVIIIAIAGIGILNLLLMAVYERTREIGLLGAMGLKPRQIATLFILEGTMIGVVGVVAGVVLGLALNGSLGVVGLDYSAFSSISDYMALVTTRVYPTLGLNNLFARAVTVIIISTLAAWIPASEAARREPAQALHHV